MFRGLSSPRGFQPARGCEQVAKYKCERAITFSDCFTVFSTHMQSLPALLQIKTHDQISAVQPQMPAALPLSNLQF